MNKTLEKLEEIGLVPVIKIDDAAMAVPLARALIAGGLPCAEITFRTAAGAEAIRRISAEVPDIILGAGTVLNTKQVDEACAAGASFIVSPGFNPKVVEHCVSRGVAVTPGCANPSDMEAAVEMGLDVVKFFPAEQAGGLAYIKAVSAPYSSLKFMPTGGITPANLNSYLAFEKIIACGGSWMVPQDALNSGDFAAITALCSEASAKITGFSLAHVGINAADAEEARETAKIFELMFGFAAKEGNTSVFAGEGVEVMKPPYYGKNGHIAIGVNSLHRAAALLKRKGYSFNEESVKFDAKGRMAAIYLNGETGGFAVHLVQKKL